MGASFIDAGASLAAPLTQGRDLRFIVAALLCAGLGSYASLSLLTPPSAAATARTRLGTAFPACLFGISTWVTYVLIVRGAFPSLDPVDAWFVNVEAGAIPTFGALAAFSIAHRARPGYRDLLLAGAVIACATQCMAFFALTHLTAPYRLAYQLGPLTMVTLFSAAIAGFGLGQASRPHNLMQQIQAASCLAGTQVAPAAVGLAAILSFSDWLTEASRPDTLSTEPIIIVLAACGMVVLVLGVVGSAIDHYTNLQSNREAARMRHLVDGAMEGIIIHRDGLVLDANSALCGMAGTSSEALRGKPLSDLFETYAGPCGAGREELDLRSNDGGPVPVEVLSRSIDYRGEPADLLAVRDLTERRAAEARILHLAHHDVLTGLANRTLLNERLLHAFMAAERSGQSIAALCLDLDRFKAVNDTLGHAAGDTLLKKVAGRLREAVRAGDTVARIGGDEFVIVQAGGPQPEAATTLAARIIETVSAPYDLDGQQASIGTSVGIALYPQDALGASDLLKRADVALYRAKSARRGTSRLYEPGMDQAMRDRQQMEADLRRAVEMGQMELHYQPLLSCDTTDVIGFEALARWNHPTRGRISPADFIPLAEETGVIVQLGRWAVETACQEAVLWPSRLRVAVNLSPAQIRRDDVAAMVALALDKTGLPGSRLELEVTEGLLMVEPSRALDALQRLRTLGVRVALDDFGTGYSSLGYLHRFPFDRIKIDQSFVQSLGIDASAQAIIDAILAMSRSLDLDVTAEGVETDSQLSLLQSKGCGSVQGFLLAKPMQASAVESFLSRFRVAVDQPIIEAFDNSSRTRL